MAYGSRYFAVQEFHCKNGCGFGSRESDIAPDLVYGLHLIRTVIKLPMVVTSGARCAKQNIAARGRARSTHLAGVAGLCSPEYVGQCRAADISILHWSPEARKQVIQLALQMGLRVGVADKFLHFDVENEPYYREGLWHYSETADSSTGGIGL